MMKTSRLFLLVLAGVSIAGCNHKLETPSPTTAPAPASTGPAVAAIPLPEQTPYDGNAKARALFLKYYAAGYHYSATGEYGSMGCTCDSEGDPERYEAALDGFFAGKKAGAAAFAVKPQQGQVPTAEPSGTAKPFPANPQTN